jgi:hypothetical protein
VQEGAPHLRIHRRNPAERFNRHSEAPKCPLDLSHVSTPSVKEPKMSFFVGCDNHSKRCSDSVEALHEHILVAFTSNTSLFGTVYITLRPTIPYAIYDAEFTQMEVII